MCALQKPLKDRLQTLIADLSSTSKSVAEFAAIDRFCLPQSQEAVWERTKHNTKHFKSNYIIAISLCALCGLLCNITTTFVVAFLSAVVAIACSHTKNHQHKVYVAGASFAVVVIATHFVVLAVSGACVGIVLCGLHSLLLPPEVFFNAT
jgi:hypothetical protein